MALQLGIIGLPNVGKSTLFNALTQAGVPAANYPFCTIDPNVGTVPVPDGRLEKIAAVTQPQTCTPAVIEFVDIAGLVKGASKGEGLGNQFLAHIRNVDAVIQVVRVFEDSNVAHSLGDPDPMQEAEIVETELILSDLQTLANRYQRTEKMLKTGERRYREELVRLEKVEAVLNEGRPIRQSDAAVPQDLPLLTSKPILYLANVGDEDIPDPSAATETLLEPLREWSSQRDAGFITLCAEIEAEIAELEGEDALEIQTDLGLDEPGLHKVIRAGKELLNLITFYTVKGPETRAWNIPAGTKAQQAAGVIHSDMERGFIRAEVIPWQTLLEKGSFVKAKEEGLLRSEGRDYVMQDGDVVLFRFNV